MYGHITKSIADFVELVVVFIAFAFPLKFFFDAVVGIVGWKNPVIISLVVVGFIGAMRRER